MRGILFPERQIICLGLLLLLLSIAALLINSTVMHYPGNNYFPPDSAVNILTLILIYAGLCLLFGKNTYWPTLAKEFFFFFLVISLILIATNAIQFTPFDTIDHRILALDASLCIDLNVLLAWVDKKPLFKSILENIYLSLAYQLLLFPLLVIATKRFNYVREFYFLLLISALIGFTFYYFFPTTAPASILTSPFFTEEQRATGLKFLQIHEHIPPTTKDGGMISLPSFHVIWAWFCLYLIRSWKIVFLLLLPINSLLMLSCVLLGWHYALDILGAGFVIIISHVLYWRASCVYDFTQVRN